MDVVFYPALFPPVSYMAWWVSNTSSWSSSPHFQKGSWVNRYRILGPNGVQDLSAPIIHASKGPIKEVRLEHRNSWAEKEWRAIKTAYSNASFFEALEFELSNIVTRQHEFLIDRLEEAMHWTLEQLLEPSLIIVDESVSPDERISPKGKPESAEYRQVFKDRHGFQGHLSILDLLMNEGPLAHETLLQQNELFPYSEKP